MSLESLSHIAELTGHSPRLINSRIQHLKPIIRGRSHLYETKTVLPLLYGRTDDGEKLDPQQERAKLDQARRAVVELDHARRQGALLDAQDVTKAWAEMIRIARGRLLAMPQRIAPELIRLSELRAIELRLTEAVHEVLTELAGGTDR